MSKRSINSNQQKNRREERRLQLEREQRMKQLRLWIPIAIVVLGLLGLFTYRLFEPDVAGVVFAEREIPGNQHDAALQIPFGAKPPMGGPHNPTWQNCGIYDTPVEAQYAIHSMEHGAIWITYQPDLPIDEVQVLEDVALKNGRILLAPYPEQTSQVVLTAWDLQLELNSVTDERLEKFVDRYTNTRGPERGASCDGGRGTPLG